MASHDVAHLASHLRTEYGDDLRWVAYYNSRSYTYQVEHLRDDLRNELTENQLDRVIHRSLAVYNKRHAEEVYFHLGESDYLIVLIRKRWHQLPPPLTALRPMFDA
jgi:hypothetical protein